MTIFLAAFTTVFLLTFQHLNINRKLYLWAVITSIGISIGQYLVVVEIKADESSLSLFMMTAGGAIGVVTSMFSHERLVALIYDRKRTTKQ